MPNQLTHAESKSQFSPAAVHHAARLNKGHTLFEEQGAVEFAIQEKPINGNSKSGSASHSANGDGLSDSTHFLNYLKIQPKLIVGQPDDKYEQEADHVAESVMHMPESDVPPKPT